MQSFTTTEIVPYSPRQMFDLVADVAAYPESLPLCEALAVRERNTLDDGRPQLVADMTCGYKAIRETFTSRVTLDRQNNRILVEYIDGPFRHLRNEWRFDPAPSPAGDDGRCAVKFDIDYSFKSSMLGLLVGAMFDKAFRRFLTAFKARAADVYRGSGEAPVVSPA